MAGNTFAEAFARKRILPQQQGQSDFSFEDEKGARAGLNYQSLVPTAGKPRTRKQRAGGGGAKRPPRNFRRQSAAELKRVLGIRGTSEEEAEEHVRGRKLVCPSDLPPRLHRLWMGYCETVLNLQSVGQLPTRLETVLRMDLIGAHMRVAKSTSTRQAGLEGIVVMETRNVFYIADLPPQSVEDTPHMEVNPSPATEQEEGAEDCSTTVPASSRPRLHVVPKEGTLFVLVLGSLPGSTSGTVAEVALNGSAVAQRPVDRALRKWRTPAWTAASKKLAAKRRIWQDALFCAAGVQLPEDDNVTS